MAKYLSVTVTFKQDERWLWEEVQKHSGKGNWIKDVLTEHLQAEKSETLRDSSTPSIGGILEGF